MLKKVSADSNILFSGYSANECCNNQDDPEDQVTNWQPFGHF